MLYVDKAHKWQSFVYEDPLATCRIHIKINMEIFFITENEWVQVSRRVESIFKILSEKVDIKESEQEWLDVKKACAYLKVTPRCLQNYRDKGVIPFSKIGGKILYRKNDLNEYLLENRINPFSSTKNNRSI